MYSSQGLVTTALCMSIVSTILSVVALWPHLKDRLSVVRDVVLWIAVIAIGVTLLFAFQRQRALGRPAERGDQRESFAIFPPYSDSNLSWRPDAEAQVPQH